VQSGTSIASIPSMAAKSSRAKKSTTQKPKRWSARVTRESHALALEADVFKKESAGEIARSLKRSAERSTQRKSSPFRSAMSMLNFYINRAGDNLPAARVKVLDRAKEELRKLYDRPSASDGKTSKGAKKTGGRS
jgi:cob(I)alamin adenosyltransferase